MNIRQATCENCKTRLAEIEEPPLYVSQPFRLCGPCQQRRINKSGYQIPGTIQSIKTL